MKYNVPEMTDLLRSWPILYFFGVTVRIPEFQPSAITALHVLFKSFKNLLEEIKKCMFCIKIYKKVQIYNIEF
jgi:hypothetical protein